jgi:hypothetical protein
MDYKRKIYFTAGSGGNHLRWLMYFDKNFSSLDDMDKLSFVQRIVYNPTRTWNNWLEIEWKHRPRLDPVMSMNHHDPDDTPDTLVLSMIFENQNLPFEHYFHINLGMNCATPEKFKEAAQRFTAHAKCKKQSPNNKTLKCDVMFDQTLNRDFYLEVCEFFKMEDHFDQAEQIHELWYLARKNSARDFCKYFLGNDFQSYVVTLQKKYNLE